MPDPDIVEVLDSNLSTFTAEADEASWIGGPQPVIVHAEILAGRDFTLLERLHWYNTLPRRRHRVPVWTVVPGRKRLGAQDERVKDAIMAMTDRERLLQRSDRIAQVASWEE